VHFDPSFTTDTFQENHSKRQRWGVPAVAQWVKNPTAVARVAAEAYV